MEEEWIGIILPYFHHYEVLQFQLFYYPLNYDHELIGHLLMNNISKAK
jgi:hypothetical protein